MRYIPGDSYNNTLEGTSDDDTIVGLGGNDTIFGRGGDDSLLGGDGDDYIEGNLGDDSLYGGNGNDTLTDDFSIKSNLFDGGPGDDNLTSLSLWSQHTLLGGTGNDTLYVKGQRSNMLDGGAGNDNLMAQSLSGQHTLLGGTDNDTLNATGQTVYLDGGDQDDNISATGGLRQQDGSTSFVSGGSTILLGGTGTDSLTVSYYSNASLDGGAGNDSLSTTYSRFATLQGGTGEDTLNVFFSGYSSNSTDGNNRLSESYELDGGDDNDTLTVIGDSSESDGQTTTSLYGGAGNDTLRVTDNRAGAAYTNGVGYGIAQATLDGGPGDDMLEVGGVLQLTMTGGDGVDTFILTAQQYRTLREGTRDFRNVDDSTTSVMADPVLITDFAAGAGGDVLDYSDLLSNGTVINDTPNYDGSNPFVTGFLILEQSGSDTLLSFDPDGQDGAQATPIVIVRLQNVTASTLTAANFNPNFDLTSAQPPVNTITGNSSNNVLLSTVGDDAIDGGAGIDTVSYANATAAVNVTLASNTEQDTGGAGIDTLLNIENLTGSKYNDTLTGNVAANVLNGGAGADTMTGGNGNDTYYVNHASDVVNEVLAGGTDTVFSTLLAYTLRANVEKGVVQGTVAGNLTGNALANTLTGNAAANRLNGGAGNDTLKGNGGNDILTGGAGKDVLTGGAGNDVFKFNTLVESGLTATTRDVITDFVRGQDKIDLSTIDANTALAGNQAFTGLIGANVAFSQAGQLRLNAGVLYGNTDADATAEFSIALTGITTLANTDFVL